MSASSGERDRHAARGALLPALGAPLGARLGILRCLVLVCGIGGGLLAGLPGMQGLAACEAARITAAGRMVCGLVLDRSIIIVMLYRIRHFKHI